MAAADVLIGDAQCLIGDAALLWDDGAGAPPVTPAGFRLGYSFKPQDSLVRTNMIGRFQDVRQGGQPERYAAFWLQQQGHVSKDGWLETVPDDASMNVGYFVSGFTGIKQAVSTYQDEALLFFIYDGALGAGNTLSFGGSYSGQTVTLEDSGATSYEIKMTLDAPASVNSLIPTYNIGNRATLNAPRAAVVLESELSDFLDIPNNPYKTYRASYRTKLDTAPVLRNLDDGGPININFTTHWKDYGQLTGVPSELYAEPYADQPFSYGFGNHGFSLEGFFDLCVNGSPTARPWVPWFCIPGLLNSGVRANTLSRLSPNDGTYYEDGVAQTWDANSVVAIIDPAWWDLSSVSVGSPSKGEITNQPRTLGDFVYDPSAGVNPVTHTAGETTETVVITGNRINWDLVTDTPSVGGPASFTVPFRVQDWAQDGQPQYYRTIMNSGQLFSLNPDWFLDENRNRTNARHLVQMMTSTLPNGSEAIIEDSSETWNSAARFELNSNFFQGVVNHYAAEIAAWRTANGFISYNWKECGAGILLAVHRYWFEIELAAAGYSYDIKWAISCQTHWDGLSAAAAADGHRFAWQHIFGLDDAQADAKMADFYVASTGYMSNAYRAENDYYASQNLTGERDYISNQSGDGTQTVFTIAGAAGAQGAWDVVAVNSGSGHVELTEGVDYTVGVSGSDVEFTFTTPPPDLGAGSNNIRMEIRRHSWEVLQRFTGAKSGYAADSSTLVQDYKDWMIGPRKEINVTFIKDAALAFKTQVELRGGKYLGFYEDGFHDQFSYNMPSVLRNSTDTNSGGQTFRQWYLAQMNGALGEYRVQQTYAAVTAAVGDDWIYTTYGGFFEKTEDSPWDRGRFENAPTLEQAALEALGRGGAI